VKKSYYLHISIILEFQLLENKEPSNQLISWISDATVGDVPQNKLFSLGTGVTFYHNCQSYYKQDHPNASTEENCNLNI